MKTFWKIISAFFAVLISIVLIVSLVVLPCISFLTDFAEPRRLLDFVSSSGLLEDLMPSASHRHQPLLSTSTVEGLPEGVDIGELLGALEELANNGVIDVEQLMEDLEIPTDVVIDQEQLTQDLTQSEAVQELISTYAEDILNAAAGTGEPPKLTSETVIEIIQPHMEEIVEIVDKSLPPEVTIDKEKLTNAVEKVTKDALPTLVETLPPAKDVAASIVAGEDPTIATVLSALNFVRQGTLRTIAIALIAALIVFIFLFRLPTINGLRWVGVNGLISGILVGSIGYVLQADFLMELLSSLSIPVNAMVSLLDAISGTFITFAVIYGVAGLVLIIVNGVINALVAARKKAAAAPAPVPVPAAPVASSIPPFIPSTEAPMEEVAEAPAEAPAEIPVVAPAEVPAEAPVAPEADASVEPAAEAPAADAE